VLETKTYHGDTEAPRVFWICHDEAAYAAEASAVPPTKCRSLALRARDDNAKNTPCLRVSVVGFGLGSSEFL